MSNGGFIAKTIHDEKIDGQFAKYTDYEAKEKWNGRRVLLIDNCVCRESVKIIGGTEVTIGYAFAPQHIYKYNKHMYDAINIEGDISPYMREEVMKLCKQKES